jgi:hypothetical protein
VISEVPYLNPSDEELDNYLLDIYGTCTRDQGKQNDCYWGKDANGRDNGCLKIGWKGRACPHWQPISETQLQQIRRAYGGG